MLHSLDFVPEFRFRTSRSGGKGGQNVNKVETRVELEWDVDASVLVTEEQKQLIREKLTNRINNEGILQVASEVERSQLANKELVIEKFYELLEQALKKPKKRKKTKPPKAAVEKRLKEKKAISEKKENRRMGF